MRTEVFSHHDESFHISTLDAICHSINAMSVTTRCNAYSVRTNGVRTLVVDAQEFITEGVVIHDMMRVRNYLDQKKVRLIGPNCPGLLTPGEAKVGIIPGNIAIPGNVGVVSRSGTLTYEVLYAMKNLGMGASTCVGIGGDPVNGTNFTDVLEMFEHDPKTEKVIMIGEIGGNEEEKAAEFIRTKMTKPVASFIAGQTAPPGKRMGHAGAIIEGGAGTAADKVKALEAAGVKVAKHPEEIPTLLQ